MNVDAVALVVAVVLVEFLERRGRSGPGNGGGK